MKKSKFKSILDEFIESLIKKAIKKHGKFHNNHEVYGVLLEEIEEAETDLNAIKNYFNLSWEKIKKDEIIDEEIERIKQFAEHAIYEMLDIIVTCEKSKIL